MMIKVSSNNEAMTLARHFITGYGVYYDSTRSQGAGYDIYAGCEDPAEYICDLGNRLEVNLPADRGGKSYNIWIDDGLQRAESDGKKDMEKKLNDSKQMANCIACLASEMIKKYVKGGIYGTEEFNTWATIKGLAETLIDTVNIEQ